MYVATITTIIVDFGSSFGEFQVKILKKYILALFKTFLICVLLQRLSIIKNRYSLQTAGRREHGYES